MGALLLCDDETSSNISKTEFLYAPGALNVAVEDSEVGDSFAFEIVLEVSLYKIGELSSPRFLSAAVQDIKMTQAVADVIQIVIQQRIEAHINPVKR